MQKFFDLIIVSAYKKIVYKKKEERNTSQISFQNFYFLDFLTIKRTKISPKTLGSIDHGTGVDVLESVSIALD
jgi:hypothetical protein